MLLSKKMDKLECDYRDCDQQFKTDLDLNQHKHGHFKKRNFNLSINLPDEPTNYQNLHSNLTPRSLTPFVVPNLYKNCDDAYSLNDELIKYQSPNLFKDPINPFEETFKKAISNPFQKTNVNFDDNYDKNESLNTPSIDLTPKKLLNLPVNCTKLDLLVASSDQVLLCDNFIQNNNESKLDYQTDDLSVAHDCDESLKANGSTINSSTSNASRQQTNKANKRILPKPDDNIVPEYKYSLFLKLPDGSSLPITTSTTSQQTVSNTQSINVQSNTNSLDNYRSPVYQPQQQFDPTNLITTNSQPTQQDNAPAKVKTRRNSTKKTTNQLDKVETTTLKSIKNALEESSSQLSQFNQLESVNSSSSQSSNSSSTYQTNVRELNENSNSTLTSLDLSLSANGLVNNGNAMSTSQTINGSSKTKPGRRSKNQPKEHPDERKARSLERNREAAMRCRTKRKVWVNALEENADNLEKQNKELHQKYLKLKEEVQLLKTALLNNKLDHHPIYPVNMATSHLNEQQSSNFEMSATNLVNQQPPQTSESNRPNSKLFDYLIAAVENKRDDNVTE